MPHTVPDRPSIVYPAGLHVALIAVTADQCKAWRHEGLEFRDTILVMTEVGATLVAVFRAPTEGTVIEQIARTERGALHVDACRVAHRTVNGGNLADNPHLRVSIRMGANVAPTSLAMQRDGDLEGKTHDAGRWPPNVLLTHGTCADDICAPDCPVAMLDEQSGERPTGRPTAGATATTGAVFGAYAARSTVGGGASRFFPTFEAGDDWKSWFARLVGGVGRRNE